MEMDCKVGSVDSCCLVVAKTVHRFSTFTFDNEVRSPKRAAS